MQYSTTGNILDNIFTINSCNYLYRTACAIARDALTDIFLNLGQLRITREASFSMCKHVLHVEQVYEIPRYFYHTFLLKLENFEKNFGKNFV